MHRVRGVIARSKGAPVSVETILVPDPGPGEALVRVQACGVCHTDLGFYYHGVPTRHALPLALGHEISGRVVEAGAGMVRVTLNGKGELRGIKLDPKIVDPQDPEVLEDLISFRTPAHEKLYADGKAWLEAA